MDLCIARMYPIGSYSFNNICESIDYGKISLVRGSGKPACQVG
jgi:hypothetical protein